MTQVERHAVTTKQITHLHLDPIGGMSGDMFLGTMLDACPELFDGLVDAMRTAGLPSDWQVNIGPAKDHAMTGSRLSIVPPASGKSRPTGTFLKIKEMLETSDLAPNVLARALDIFTHLARAEAKAHGTPLDKVHFHEVADWDSVADIVGAAFCIEAFPGATWSVGPIPLGGGRVQTSHGPLPVPAPATAELLKDFVVIDDGVSGERVTPTGAAILRSLEPDSNLPKRKFSLQATGQGFGTKSFDGLANMLRLLVYTEADAAASNTIHPNQIAVIRFEIDDQSPEDLAIGLGRILDIDAVRDITQWPVFGKKGRLGSSIQILCDSDALEQVAETCFLQTTTIGLRYRLENRMVLDREAYTVMHRDKPLRVKEVMRPDGERSVKIEADDLFHAETQLERGDLRRSLEKGKQLDD